MSARFTWSVSTPGGVAASGQCEFLVVPTTGGELGVLADHAALVASVAPGERRVTASDSASAGVRAISVGPGVVDVRDNVVRLLVSRAEKPPRAGAGTSTDA